MYTALFIQSVAMFCYSCLLKLRGPAWAEGSYSRGPPAGGTPQILISKILGMTGRIVLYVVTLLTTRVIFRGCNCTVMSPPPYYHRGLRPGLHFTASLADAVFIALFIGACRVVDNDNAERRSGNNYPTKDKVFKRHSYTTSTNERPLLSAGCPICSWTGLG